MHITAFANALGVLLFMRKRPYWRPLLLAFVIANLSILAAFTYGEGFVAPRPYHRRFPPLLRGLMGVLYLWFAVQQSILCGGILPLLAGLASYHFYYARRCVAGNTVTQSKYAWSLRTLFGVTYFAACNIWTWIAMSQLYDRNE